MTQLLVEHGFLIGLMTGVCAIGSVLLFVGISIGRRTAARENWGNQ